LEGTTYAPIESIHVLAQNNNDQVDWRFLWICRHVMVVGHEIYIYIYISNMERHNNLVVVMVVICARVRSGDMHPLGGTTNTHCDCVW
jgi:hypothetical protein